MTLTASSLLYTPTDFVAIFNQSIENNFKDVVIEGELSNYSVSKNAWLYFSLVDEFASVPFFGTVRQLPGPLENGLKLKVTARPFLHPKYGFRLQVGAIELSGEGSIKKAFDLLKIKLEKEGLFKIERKRPLPYPPESIGLITSSQSAAYGDFIKVAKARWGYSNIRLIDVSVQGQAAANEVVTAIESFNALAVLPEVLVIIRGGGSSDDLQVFSSEQVTRAIAISRIPTLVAIGHERDISLAELAADVRASTPSNAAELLLPDKTIVKAQIESDKRRLLREVLVSIANARLLLDQNQQKLPQLVSAIWQRGRDLLSQQQVSLHALGPYLPLKRGYALIALNGRHVSSIKQLIRGGELDITLQDGIRQARVE